ncbi:MAG: class I SAM-dependent methyltransferase [Proteobacteria bacterium]|nr:class I SAM-dependent methyltransferase [Pseudomonadota bacterium]
MTSKLKRLLEILTGKKRAAGGCRSSLADSGHDSIFYGLDEPPHHLVEPGAMAHFSGSVLCIDSRAVCALRVYADRVFVASFPVDRPTPLIGQTVPHIARSAVCGFDFDLPIGKETDRYDFELVFENGARECFFSYDIARLLELRDRLQRMRGGLEQLSMPDGPIVLLTQGHENVLSYRNSIIPFIVNVERYLAEAGVDSRDIRSVLDIGCGSGRALSAWYLDDPTRRLHGCDINEKLIAWSRRNLPPGIELVTNSVLPPLAYPDRHFDLVQLISVFTHLSLPVQRQWVDEIRRILKPGGYLLITLQNELYVQIFLPNSMAEFRQTGYLETVGRDEGLNHYGAFHAPSFVPGLFGGFEIAGYFPRGKIGGQRTIFQIASQQDVYILRRSE